MERYSGIIKEDLLSSTIVPRSCSRGECGYIASEVLSKKSRSEIREITQKAIGKLPENLTITETIIVVAKALEIPWQKMERAVRLIKSGELATEIAKKIRHGLVFTKGHVMPVVNGELLNKCGHGDEIATVAVVL